MTLIRILGVFLIFVAVGWFTRSPAVAVIATVIAVAAAGEIPRHGS